MAYLLLSDEAYDAAQLPASFIPKEYKEELSRSRSAQRGTRVADFSRDNWIITQKRGAQFNNIAKIFNLLGLQSTFIPIFPDSLRYQMEVCLQLRHSYVHEGRLPLKDDQVTLAKFFIAVFKKAADLLRIKLSPEFEDDEPDDEPDSSDDTEG